MIYLCAGHTNLKGSTYDPGAVANGYKESELTVELRDLIAKELTELKVNFKTDKDDWNLNQTIVGAKTTEKDVVFDIHFNAASSAATGCETLVPDKASELENKYAKLVNEDTCGLLKIANRGVKPESVTRHKKLGIMRPNGINLLWEVCFMTNPLEIQKYQENKLKLAKLIAYVLIKADSEAV